jgi:fluoroacetyl-CoA thioesterase
MLPSLHVGNTAQYQVTVTDAMRPVFEGKVIHEVCSTWSMGECMEIAARRVLAPHLNPDEEGVGVHLSIDHLAPARVGGLITATATATEVGPRQVRCDVTVSCDGEIVAKGHQVQRILPRTILQEMFPCKE